MAFSHDAATLCTVAPDGHALLWDVSGVPRSAKPDEKVADLPAATELIKPAFRLFKFFGGESPPKRGKKRDMSAQWRFVCMPSAAPASARAPPPLFAALNHPGGPGWIVRSDTRTGRCRAYAKACASMVPTLAVSDDTRLVVAGNSEGELIVFDGYSLARLHKVVAHDLFITSIMLRAATPSGIGALTGGVSYTAITCCGDNSVKLTPLPESVIKKRLPLAPFAWLSALVLLLSYVLQRWPALQTLLLPAAVQPYAAMLLGAPDAAAAPGGEGAAEWAAAEAVMAASGAAPDA